MPQNLSKEEFTALQNLSKNKDLIIQKSDKGNSVVIVQRQDYLEKMSDILSDQKKFSKVSLKDDTISNFAINQEKHVDKVLKKFVESKCMIGKTRKSLKPVGTRPGIMYGSCKVHKASVGNCPPFRPILSALNTPTYKLAKFLVPILKPLRTHEFTVKDSFHFAEEIVDQQHGLFMGSLDIDSLFTNIPLEETIQICTNELFKESKTVEGLSKTEFKELLSLSTKNSNFIFDGTLYKQIDGVAMAPPLDPTLANAFLVCHEKNWLEHCPVEHRPLYYRRYVDDIFVLFNSVEHHKRSYSYLNSRHLIISLTIENEKNNRMSFLDVNIIHEKDRFITSVYGKPTFSGIYTHFDIFLPSSNKMGLLHTLCFRICSDWTKFHLELVKLTDNFKNNGYPENFINNYFKVFLDNKYRIQKKLITVPKKTLFLVLPYLGPLSLQTRTKLRKSLKGVLNCCKSQIVFKSQNKLVKDFRFKDPIPKELTSGVVYKFQCGLYNESYYGECVRHLNVRIGEHIGISPLTSKKVKPKGSAISDHLLLCNHSPSFENFSVLTKENKKFLLELEESLLIMRVKPSLNRNIRSGPLHLFDKV